MQFHLFHVFAILGLFHLPDVGARKKSKTSKAPPPQTKTITITRKVPPVFVSTQRNLGSRPTSTSVAIAFRVISTLTETTVETTPSVHSSKSSHLTSASNTSLPLISSTFASSSLSETVSRGRSTDTSLSSSAVILSSTHVTSSSSTAELTTSAAVVTSSSTLLNSESRKSPTVTSISLHPSVASSSSTNSSSFSPSSFDQFANTITATATVTVTQAVSIAVGPSIQQPSCEPVAEVVPLARVPVIAEQIENLSNVIGRLNAILGRLLGDDSTTTSVASSTTATTSTASAASTVQSSGKPAALPNPPGNQFIGNDGTTSTTSGPPISSSSSSLSTTYTQRSFSFTVLAAITATATATAAVSIPVSISLPQLPKEAKVVDDVDFQQNLPEFNGPNKSWSHYSFSDMVADDGTLTFEKAGGMAVLDTNPFKKYVGPHQFPELDNIKFEAYSDTPVELPANTTTCFEWLAQAEIFGAENSPYPANYTQGTTDLRLAAASFSLFDPESDHSFQFLLTNDRVYAIYERLSIQRGGPLGNYASYTFAQPVAARNVTSWHALKIAMEAATRQVSWHVEGQEVFRVTKVGRHILGIFPIINMGGYEVDHYPTQINYGFGAQTLLNAYKPNNHVTPPPPCYHKIVRDALVNNASPDSKVVQIDPVKTTKIKLASFFDPNGTDPKLRVWGQGAISRVKQIRVYII